MAVAISDTAAAGTWRIPVDATGERSPHPRQPVGGNTQRFLEVLDDADSAVATPWARETRRWVDLEDQLPQVKREQFVKERAERVRVVRSPLRLEVREP